MGWNTRSWLLLIGWGLDQEMRKAVIKWLPDSRRGKMIPLGCNMYVVLKVQNGNGSRLVIVFLLPFLYFYPIFFLYILLKYFLNQFIKWYECQKVFCHSFDTSDCDPATLLPQSSKTFVIRSFFFEKWLLTHVFGGSRGQKASCKQACIGFLTFWPWYHHIINCKN